MSYFIPKVVATQNSLLGTQTWHTVNDASSIFYLAIAIRQPKMCGLLRQIAMIEWNRWYMTVISYNKESRACQ